MSARRFIAALIALTLLATPTLATVDGWPALYDVTDVSSDDVLNIRQGPSSSTPIIGTLAPDAQDVEVIRLSGNGRWGRVNAGETAGWVYMRYMARQPGQWWGAPPPVAACQGTEPFWTLQTTGAQWRLLQLGAPDVLAPAAPLAGSLADRNRHGAMTVAPDGRPLALALTARACGDGMSDRDYGLAGTVVFGTGEAAQVLAGCCTLALPGS